MNTFTYICFYSKHLSKMFKPQFLILSCNSRFIIEIPQNTFISEIGLIRKTMIVYIVIVGSNVLIKCFFKR